MTASHAAIVAGIRAAGTVSGGAAAFIPAAGSVGQGRRVDGVPGDESANKNEKDEDGTYHGSGSGKCTRFVSLRGATEKPVVAALDDGPGSVAEEFEPGLTRGVESPRTRDGGIG